MTKTRCGDFHATHREIPARVIVVDGEPLVRWSLAAGLTLAGFQADAAGTAAEALALARALPPPTVVLLDAGLWDDDPWRLYAEMREISPRCRFIILTVEGQELQLPPWDGLAVIQKPFDLHEVVRRVEAVAPSEAGHRRAG